MTDALDEEATQGEQAAKWWKWAAVTICSLLLVSTLVLGILVVFLVGSYWLSAVHDWRVHLGTVLLVLVGIAVIAFGAFVMRGVCSDGERDEGSYRKNALEVARLLAVTLTATSLFSSLLLLFFN